MPRSIGSKASAANATSCGLPTEPLQITWTPVFMRAYGRAFLQSPGPLDKGLPSYFWITPPDPNLGPEATESYLREDNDRMNVLMAIHEGVPGHYLQGAYANESPSLARAVFASGTFAEGWAVYVTQVLMDLGYRDNEPALMLTHWKFYLRAITNAIMDVAIHTADMTEDQAMELMVGGGFQEQDEARAKWLRARLTSTQLSTYYIGSLEMWDLEVEGRRRAAVASGASAASVPAQQHRRRHGRDARLRLPRAPRGGHLARHSAHQVGARARCSGRAAEVDFGLILPSYRAGATSESINAATDAAARLGWHSVFTTDHLLVEPSKRSEDYYTLFDALNTLAYLAAKQPTLKLGASVVVVPMRNAVELAKELATIDALSGGRLIVGVGVGWNETEFQHLGYGERFSQRGAYLSEAVTIWRQLWGGDTGPFKGQFHSWDEVRFAPLPAQGADLPVWFGGRDEKALRRAGRLGQGYHSSSSGHDQLAVRIPIINAAAEEAGRPVPTDLGSRPRPVRAERCALLHGRGHTRADARRDPCVRRSGHRAHGLRLRRNGPGQVRAAHGAFRPRGPRRSAMSVSRPASARPRSDGADEHDASLPPSGEELDAIERHRVAWATMLGADVDNAPELGGTLVTHSAPTSGLNYLAVTRWPDGDLSERLARVVEVMSDRGAWPSVIVCDGLTTPPNAAERLRAAGWLPVFSDRTMFTRHAPVVPHLDPELRVEAVTPATALDSVRLETDAFELLPEAMGESAELLAESVAAGTTRAFLLRLRGEAVATVRLVPGPTVAGLHAVGVDPRQRRRGYGRMLTAIATRAGLATGHKLVWLSVIENNTAAVELYRSLGFAPTFTWTRWLAPA